MTSSFFSCFGLVAFDAFVVELHRLFDELFHNAVFWQIRERLEFAKATHRCFRLGKLVDSISVCFQKPNVQCCLNDANPHKMPLYSKLGMLHFMVSTTSGHVS